MPWCQWQAVEAALDERGRFVQAKKPQRWLWHALDHKTGEGLADVLSDHQDSAVLERKALLAPFGITQCDTDSWEAYARQLEPVLHTVGQPKTQTIERKPLTLRTRIKRLARQTMGFAKATWLPDVVFGLFINRDAFGLPI